MQEEGTRASRVTRVTRAGAAVGEGLLMGAAAVQSTIAPGDQGTQLMPAAVESGSGTEWTQ